MGQVLGCVQVDQYTVVIKEIFRKYNDFWNLDGTFCLGVLVVS
jgi:hypothetical protein